MGEAADRKVKEIAETRARLESDLRELEARIPTPLRSSKSWVGVVLGGTAIGGVAMKRLMTRRSSGPRPQEVIIRVVRED
jgi:hypothetical protein